MGKNRGMRKIAKVVLAGSAALMFLVGGLRSSPPNYNFMRYVQRRNDSLFVEDLRKTKDSAAATWNRLWIYTDQTKIMSPEPRPWSSFVDPKTGKITYAPGGAVRLETRVDPDHGIIEVVPETLEVLQGKVPYKK